MKIILVTLVLAVSLAGCLRPLAPIIKIENESLLVKGKFSLRQIEREIKAAATRRGWKVAGLGQGKLKATITPRNKYVVVVEIAHTTDAISIRYKSSQNLEFDGTHIHWKANKWISQLRTEIVRRTAVLTDMKAKQ